MDISKTKAQFPIFNNHPDLIYLDNAATTHKPTRVIDSISGFYSKSNANVHRGMYPLAEEATALYEAARKKVADFINAEPEETIFVPSATAGMNGIARSLWQSGFIGESPKVITSDIEHHSSLLPWQQLAPEMMQYLKLNDKFELETDKLYSKADVLALTWISNVTGTIVPIEEIIKNNPHPYSIIDATQAIAHVPIDVRKITADFVVFSAHKLYGPMGIGVVYGKKEILDELIPWDFGGGMIVDVKRESSEFGKTPEKFEAGTPNVAGAVSLAAAIDFVHEIGIETIQQHEEELRRYALRKLQEIENIAIYHPTSSPSAGWDDASAHENTNLKAAPVISFSHNTVHAHDIAGFLGEHGIAVRAGHHCTRILHRDVLETPASVRVSFGIYNSTEDIDRFIEKLIEAIEQFS